MVLLQCTAFWVGLALILPQALSVRRRAVRFEDADGPSEGVAGPEGVAVADDAGSHGRDGLAASSGPRSSSIQLAGVGDSIIAGVGVRTLERAVVGRTAASLAEALGRPVRWRALGSTGSTSRGIFHKLVSRLPDGAVDAFVVSAGVNDLTVLRGTARFRRDFEALVDGLRAHSPGAVVVVLGIPALARFPLLPWPLCALLGLRGRTFDAVIARVAAERPGVVHAVHDPADFTPAHFADDGYHPCEAACEEIGAWVAGQLAEALERRANAGLAGPADG